MIRPARRSLALLALLTLFTRPQPAGLAAEADAKHSLELKLLDPREDSVSTTRDAVHILGRSSPEAKVTVAGADARVFPTGIFVRDNVPLQMGENRVSIAATLPDGQRAERVLTFTRAAAPPPPARTQEARLEIEPQSIEPSQDVVLSQGDILTVSFRGTPGQSAQYALPGGAWEPMEEAVDGNSGLPSGLYRASWVLANCSEQTNAPVRFRLQPKASGANGASNAAPAVAEAASTAQVGFWDSAKLRLVRVTEDGASISFGNHEVRLGGPYLTELPAGTVLRVTGVQGGNYRVRLSPGLDGWMERRSAARAPAGTPLPHLAFTSISVEGNESVDRVTIPYTAPVPFAVTPATGPSGKAALEVDFFGAHHAATWLSHRPTAKAVREVTVQQVATDHLRVTVELKQAQLWGYRVEVTSNALALLIRRAPKLAAPPDSPLKGLTIALEPGHGGMRNTGARGISGSMEKDINRLAVEELARQLEAAGAKLVVVRPGDENPSLGERARRAVEANADLFISVHANSAGHERGYLRTTGTSTYYKWPFSRDLSEAIHARLLELTGLFDFGNVGNFNYYPLRANTWMPAMLVEQAFMSHPEDEAKMLDPKFRANMMKAVLLGAEDWLKSQQKP